MDGFSKVTGFFSSQFNDFYKVCRDSAHMPSNFVEGREILGTISQEPIFYSGAKISLFVNSLMHSLGYGSKVAWRINDAICFLDRFASWDRKVEYKKQFGLVNIQKLSRIGFTVPLNSFRQISQISFIIDKIATAIIIIKDRKFITLRTLKLVVDVFTLFQIQKRDNAYAKKEWDEADKRYKYASYANLLSATIGLRKLIYQIQKWQPAN